MAPDTMLLPYADATIAFATSAGILRLFLGFTGIVKFITEGDVSGIGGNDWFISGRRVAVGSVFNTDGDFSNVGVLITIKDDVIVLEGDRFGARVMVEKLTERYAVVTDMGVVFLGNSGFVGEKVFVKVICACCFSGSPATRRFSGISPKQDRFT